MQITAVNKLLCITVNRKIGRSVLHVPDTGTQVLDNTRPFWHSSIVCFLMPPARSKEHKYHIFGQYWYTRNVPVFTNNSLVLGCSSIWDLKYTFSEKLVKKLQMARWQNCICRNCSLLTRNPKFFQCKMHIL